MQYVCHLQMPNFTAENFDILNITRDKNHSHSFRNGRIKHGFIYIVRGAMVCDFLLDSEDQLYLEAGTLLFVPKKCIYTSTYLQDSTEIKIIQFDIARGELPAYLQNPKALLLPNGGKLIDRFFSHVSSHAVGNPFHFLSCFYDLLWQIDEHCTQVPSKYKKLLPAVSELTAHYDENRLIGDYAALCGISEPCFRQLFREYTGQSPVDYRNALRLESARAKLQSGEYNVSEAAWGSGFTNLSYFVRLYKQKYGYTPKKE